MNPIKLDLHVHTVYSGDAFIQPKDLIKYAIKKGLDGFAVCDHNSLKAFHILRKLAEKANLIIIPGMEIETNYGEVLGLFLHREINVKENNNFIDVVRNIKEQEGLTIIPHPFDFLRRNRLQMKYLNENLIKKNIDGIELINSRIIFRSCVKKAKHYKEKLDLFEVGGSDAHTLTEVGNGYTLIKDCDKKDLESVKKSLLSKKTMSCGRLSPPYIHIFTVLRKLVKGLYF